MLQQLCRSVPSETFVDPCGCDTVTQAASNATQSLFDLREPLAQVVRTRVKLCLGLFRADQPIAIALESSYCIPVFRLGPRQQPGVVIEEKQGLSDGDIRVFFGLRLAATVIVANHARHITYLLQDTKFPVWDIVEKDAGRHSVVCQVTAWFLKQCIGNAYECVCRRISDDYAIALDRATNPENIRCP